MWHPQVARYLQAVKRYLENPLTIAFGAVMALMMAPEHAASNDVPPPWRQVMARWSPH